MQNFGKINAALIYSRMVGERPQIDELLPKASDVWPRGVQRLPVPHEAGRQPRVLQLRYKRARC